MDDLDDRDAEPMEMPDPRLSVPFLDTTQARLEARERHLYLLAKSYFDCREFERCTAVFLPSGLPEGPLAVLPTAGKQAKAAKGKSKDKDFHGTPQKTSSSVKSKPISEKALFLALYAKFMSGEKKKEEAQEIILGPSDKTSLTNQNLVAISKAIEDYLSTLSAEKPTTGWLEYLYGIVLAKGKNDAAAKRWLVRSVNICPFNWGAWLELCDLVNDIEEVCAFVSPSKLC